jgi:DNA-binding transcriptional MerR regulator
VRVGQVAERAGVNVETLRYYERRGLLPAPERAPSGHRRYDEETVQFLRAIKAAQEVGFTLGRDRRVPARSTPLDCAVGGVAGADGGKD